MPALHGAHGARVAHQRAGGGALLRARALSHSALADCVSCHSVLEIDGVAAVDEVSREAGAADREAGAAGEGAFAGRHAERLAQLDALLAELKLAVAL